MSAWQCYASFPVLLYKGIKGLVLRGGKHLKSNATDFGTLLHQTT